MGVSQLEEAKREEAVSRISASTRIEIALTTSLPLCLPLQEGEGVAETEALELICAPRNYSWACL